MEVLREDDMKRAQWLARARADLSTREAVRQGETAATEKTTRLRQMIHSAAVEQRQLRADIKERIRESRALLPLDFVLRRALRHYRVAKLNWGLERWGRFIHGCHVLDQERILFAPQATEIQRIVRGMFARRAVARARTAYKERVLRRRHEAGMRVQTWCRSIMLRSRLNDRITRAHAVACERDKIRRAVSLQSWLRGMHCRQRIRGALQFKLGRR